MKNQFKFFLPVFTALIAAVFAVIFTGCDLFGGGETILSINLGGSSARAANLAWPPDAAMLKDISFEILLASMEEEHTFQAKGSETFRIPIAPGVWYLEIKAYYKDALYATGCEEEVEVIAGQNNSVFVIMDRAFVMISVTDNEYTYNGSGRYATVDYSDGITKDDAGSIYVIYRDASGNQVTAPANAGTYSIYITTEGGYSYKAITAPVYAGTLTIHPKPIEIDSAAHTKVYDGGTSAVGVNVTFASGSGPGLIETADFSNVLIGTAAAAYTNASAGTTTVNITSVSITGSAAGNYKVTVPAAVTLTGADAGITKAQLTVAADNKAIGTGAAAPDFTYTITGFVNNENSSVISGIDTLSFTTSPTYDTSSPAGNYDIIIDVSGLTAANYNFTPVNGILTVADKENPIVTFPTGATLTYGQTLAEAVWLSEGSSSVTGTFAFNPSDAVPTVADASWAMVFTPDDTATYNTMSANVLIFVSRAVSPATVPAPTMYERTSDSITLNNLLPEAHWPDEQNNIEYGWSSTNDAASVSNWQAGTLFNTGLTSGTTYYFFARARQSDNYLAAVSAGTPITTLTASPGISISLWTNNNDGSIILTGPTSIKRSEGPYIATLENGYTVSSWTLQGGGQSGGAGSSITFPVSGLDARDYVLSIIVTKIENGSTVPYSAQIIITVTD